MFSNRGYISKHGQQRNNNSKHSVYISAVSNRVPNPKTLQPRMETKVILTIFSLLGFTSYIWAIVLNIGSWKSDILFSLAVLFGILKIVRFGIKTYQDYRIGELDIKEKRRHQEDSVL